MTKASKCRKNKFTTSKMLDFDEVDPFYINPEQNLSLFYFENAWRSSWWGFLKDKQRFVKYFEDES